MCRATLFVVVLFVGPLTAAPVPKSVKRVKDEVSIIGRWELVKYDRRQNSLDMAAEWLAGLGVSFRMDGERLVFVRHGTDGVDWEMRCTLDPTTTPKAIDVGADSTDLGVYELDGDTLRLRINNGIRPTAMSGDDGPAVLTYKRVKDEKKEERKDK